MSKYIIQNEINMANEPLKVQQPFLESSTEMNKLRCITNQSLVIHRNLFISVELSKNFSKN